MFVILRDLVIFHYFLVGQDIRYKRLSGPFQSHTVFYFFTFL